MKALNRAIARTVSQIARHAGEGCHVPMIMALENHLDALLGMERKRLEMAGMEFATLAGGGTVLPQPHANDNAPPAPDAIDMSDPRNWQEGDIVLRTGHDWIGFYQGSEYRVAKVKPGKEEIYIARDGDGAWTGYTFDLMREDRMFKWVRHGESEAAA